MRRLLPWGLGVALAACAGNPAAAPAPASAPSPDAAPPATAAAVPPLPALPAPDSQLVRELVADARLAADSAADEAILERLADAHPGEETDEPEEVVVPATWDIDVTTWGDHDRVQYYLNFFQGPARERFQIWLDRLPRYEPMIRARLQQEGLPSDMLYLALIESGFSNTAVSRARAVGMWQFMKATGAFYGLRVNGWLDERRDPVKATDAAARHLRDLRERFGSLYLAAAAYNAGGGKISRGLKRIGPGQRDEEEDEEGPGFSDADFFRLYDTRHIRRETKDYVPKLIAAALIAKEPEKYGFRRPSAVEPFAADSLVVEGMTGLDVIARLADTTLAAIRELNPHLLRLVTPPQGRTVVRVPAGAGERVTVAYAELPAADRVTFAMHQVKRGESFSGIAKRYGVPMQVVVDANPRWRGKKLRAGSTLYVPTSGAMSPAVAREVAALGSVDADAGRARVHRVRSGETLSGIAQRYRVSVASLRRWNGLGGTSMIRAGQRLRVSAPGTVRTQTLAASAPRAAAHAKGDGAAAPRAAAAKRPATHLVRRGETFTSIAKRYGTTVAALKDANPSQARGLKAGARLRIPAA